MKGVDVQNQPWSDIWPIVAGEPWLCDIATHLKEELGLGANNIAVITGGISGAQKVGGIQNFPDSAFDCAAIDVIGVHGYFSQGDDVTAGTPWANLFLPNNTITSRADAKGKLLLVEEWSYVNTKFGLNYKKQAVFDQGNALNYRGIPWVSFLLDELVSCASLLMRTSFTRSLLSKLKVPLPGLTSCVSLQPRLGLFRMYSAAHTRLAVTSTGANISPRLQLVSPISQP